MNWKRAWDALLGRSEPITQADLNMAHQLGMQTGLAIGETKGRAAALSQLESLLLSRRQFGQNFTLDDVQSLKVRSVH